MQKVITTYLEINSRTQLHSKPRIDGLVIKDIPSVNFLQSKHLHHLVGKNFNWVERNDWTNEIWKTNSEDNNVTCYSVHFKNSEAGYFELVQQAEGNVEIIYFGLAKDFIGKGLGGSLLTIALEIAWDCPNTKRVWLHTCTDDHPNAINNYKARGMKIYKEEVE
ncbi:MAG: GNAT family N-acetyltransferase, partial [Flavobacteriales bacterium]|nr:GNAT family N-acetyltransferase [Flavobacteriales bacterium]